MSPGLETAVIALCGAGASALVAVGIYLRARAKARNGNGNGNGHGRRSGEPAYSATARLQVWDEEWRKEVRDEIRGLQREIFERDGAVRGGDHQVRDDVQVVIGEMAKTRDEQYRELRGAIEKVSDDVSDLAVSIAKHPGHCSHCLGGA